MTIAAVAASTVNKNHVNIAGLQMSDQNPAEGLRQQIQTIIDDGDAYYSEDMANSIMLLITAYAATVERETRFSEAFHIAKMESISGEPEANNRIAEAWNGAALQGPQDEPAPGTN